MKCVNSPRQFIAKEPARDLVSGRELPERLLPKRPGGRVQHPRPQQAQGYQRYR